jgi:ribosome-associated protein
MINITDGISVGDDEIKLEFIRSSGPGGQNVNKVSSAVQLRFDIKKSPSLPQEIAGRLIQKAGKRVTSEGILIITARRFRDQNKNREDALFRLADMIRKAAENKKPRIRTKPSSKSRMKRLEAKRRKSGIKMTRKSVSAEE